MRDRSSVGVVVLVGVLLLAGRVDATAAGGMSAGAAAVDVTPDYPVRLSGFGFRREESNGVRLHIHAKALALSGSDGKPAVLITVDNLGIPDYMTQDVAQRLSKKASLDPTRLSISASHTHTAPMLTDVCPTLFGVPIPPEHQQHIDRYTKELADKLEQVALDAIKDLKPAKVEFAIGSASFAKNRRTAGGPVDHDLPMLAVKDADGKLRAIYVSYACHCVTLADNKVSGDWAGYVQELVQEKHPGAIALTSVGCGADSNPSARASSEKGQEAIDQGAQIASEVDRLLSQPMTPIDATLTTTLGRIELAFDTLPTRAQWEEKAKRQDAVGHHARVQLAKLDRREQLQTKLSYPIQTWQFGDKLAMVFLSGEVVVDYSLRLKREFDRDRIWVNAYSNDAPCYIPSERVLKEGGYEGGDAMVYYDRPTRFAPGLEKQIVDEIHRQLPESFVAKPGTEGVPPKSPQQSLQSIRTKAGLRVELVASEPLVQSPVAIDWSADGRLWVCEMVDYPTGIDRNWKPGGRVKVLEDRDGDGVYEKSTVFLDHIPFPTGVTAWGKGVFVCAAPDILFAEDTDGDGKADKVEKRFTGFFTDNYQARVNSLSLGLDNWIYGANGLLGGTITSSATAEKLDIRNHDFRFRPGTGEFETVSGLTQQGRVRDDWGRWFGCDNSRALFWFPTEERYFRRNESAPAPPATLVPEGDYDIARLYPVSRTLERFNDVGSANHVTSACGLGIYRDTLLGDAFYGNAFTCEPVHNLVHRMVLSGDGGADGKPLTRRRADDEKESEFLASSDNWFRPVQARTGPDGALYIVDMYRFLIEHPRWIQADRLAKIDVRAGSEMGRIYRIRPATDAPLRKVRDLTKLSSAELAAALDTPNGTERDRVHMELLSRHRCDGATADTLKRLARSAALPQVRISALCALDGVGSVGLPLMKSVQHDGSPFVRRQALRLCELTLREDADKRSAELAESFASLVNDPSPLVRRQLAFTLGEWNDPRAGELLAALAKSAGEDADLRLPVLSSASRFAETILRAVLTSDGPEATREAWVPPLIATIAASGDPKRVEAALTLILPADDAVPSAGQFEALASLLDVPQASAAPDHLPAVARAVSAARRIAADEASAEPLRVAAVKLLGGAGANDEEVKLLCHLAASAPSESLRSAAVARLRPQQGGEVAKQLLAGWRQTSPAAREPLVELLLSRDEWTLALLDAVRGHVVEPSEISLADRQRLVSSGSEPVRTLAEQLLPQVVTASRADVLAKYAGVSRLNGVAKAGADLFARNCSACHLLGDTGHAVGPDLSALRDKDVDYFAKNILDPSAVIEPKFVAYTVRLKDRRVLSGLIRNETPTSLTLLSGNGVTEQVRRADVAELRASATSMMPEGLEAALPPQQLADLIAFLKGPQPQARAAIKRNDDGAYLLPATAAAITGESIRLESDFHNLGYWNSAADQATWTIDVDRAGDYDVYLDHACAADSAGNTFRLTAASGKRAITGVVPATGADWSTYRLTKAGTLHLDPGRQRLTIRPEGAVRGALFDLRTIVLTPAGAKPPAAAAANR